MKSLISLAKSGDLDSVISNNMNAKVKINFGIQRWWYL